MVSKKKKIPQLSGKSKHPRVAARQQPVATGSGAAQAATNIEQFDRVMKAYKYASKVMQ